jgi:hypothetical protein
MFLESDPIYCRIFTDRRIRKAVETIRLKAALDSPDLSYFYRLFARNYMWAEQGRANANTSKQAFVSYITNELHEAASFLQKWSKDSLPFTEREGTLAYRHWTLS